LLNVKFISAAVMFVESWDSSVGTGTDYELGDRGSILGSGEIFLFIAPRQALGPAPNLLFNVYLSLSPGVKWQRREADHSPPSRAEVMIGGAVPPLPHLSS
jgi:hypothetical protein